MLHGKPSRSKSALQGFSLIEISIVLVIIGLIIGATIKGRDLIESARLNALLMQVNSYRLAIQSFRDQYNALPGDFKEASLHFKDMQNGDGDGMISGEGLNVHSDAGKVWQHLGAAGMIPSCGKPTGEFLASNQGAPSTKVGGVIALEQNPEDEMPGLWLIVGRPNEAHNTGGLFTPHQAKQLLNKFGHVSPDEGAIRVKNGAKSGDACIASGDLKLLNTQESCILYFQVD